MPTNSTDLTLISDDLSLETRKIFVTVNIVVLVKIISIFGINSNAINIYVFCKQGFSEPTNISYTGLALSDMLTLVASLCLSIFWNPMFLNSGLPVVFVDIQAAFAALPFACFSRITGCVTALITCERCLCVVWPLKVKEIFSSTVIVVLVVSIYLGMFLTMVPIYSALIIGWMYDPLTNRTVLGALVVENVELLSNISYSLDSAIQLFAFIVVLICTATLIMGLRQNTSRRKELAKAQNAAKKATKRQDKAIKVVTLIAIIYVVCYLPTIISLAVTALQSNFTPKGRYKNVFFAVWTFVILFGVLNSSVNLLVYYHMSSKFKQTCDQTLTRLFSCVSIQEEDITTETVAMRH